MELFVIPVVLLMLGLGATIAVACGATGLLYAALYAIAIAPGLPLGWGLFGRAHGAGWIAGALFGYGTTQLALWLPIALADPSAATFLVAWISLSLIQLVLGARIKGPLVPLASWTPADARALVLVMLLGPALMIAPYRNLAALDAEGNRYYRAYFTADFFWHTALVGELGKYSMPPRNPYMASRAMNYYWAYFLLPAVVAKSGPAPLRDVQTAVKTNALCSAVLLFGAMFLLVRLAVRSPSTAAVASALGILCPSAEGSWVIQQLLRSGAPLSSVTGMNIDAITAWQFQGLRIDNLARSIWYNAQHSTACALGLVALVIAARGPSPSLAVALLAGMALAFATCMNPFVGGVFALIYGCALVWQTVVSTRDWRPLAVQVLAGVPVLAAVMWCASNRVFAGAGTAVTFGLSPAGTNSPIATLLLSMGVILVPAIAGAWRFRDLDEQAPRVAVTGVVIALGLLYFVTLSESSWVGFRAGQILLLLSPVLFARFLDVLIRRHARYAVALAIAMIVIGFPTTAIDVYNAQDIHNRRQGPGFRWTLSITPGQHHAFTWIQGALPEDAVVQMEPIVRGREHWSLIPTFAQRRMAAGLPISLLPMPEYQRGSEQVRAVFASSDARDARDAARRLRIDYVYVDQADRHAYASGIAKFAEHGEYFRPVFDNGEVTIFRVE